MVLNLCSLSMEIPPKVVLEYSATFIFLLQLLWLEVCYFDEIDFFCDLQCSSIFGKTSYFNPISVLIAFCDKETVRLTKTICFTRYKAPVVSSK